MRRQTNQALQSPESQNPRQIFIHRQIINTQKGLPHFIIWVLIRNWNECGFVCDGRRELQSHFVPIKLISFKFWVFCARSWWSMQRLKDFNIRLLRHRRHTLPCTVSHAIKAEEQETICGTLIEIFTYVAIYYNAQRAGRRNQTHA